MYHPTHALSLSPGDVITPYIKYPWLLDTIFSIVTEGKTPSIRLEGCRVLGILGAVDPQATAAAAAAQPTDSATTALQKSQAVTDLTFKAVGSEIYYQVCCLYVCVVLVLFIHQRSLLLKLHRMQDLVVKELIEIAYTPTLAHLHNHTIRCCGIIVVKSGSKFVPYLSQVGVCASFN